jgi:hypothetical protein
MTYTPEQRRAAEKIVLVYENGLQWIDVAIDLQCHVNALREALMKVSDEAMQKGIPIALAKEVTKVLEQTAPKERP